MLTVLASIAGVGAVPLEGLRLSLQSINRQNLRPDTAVLRWVGSHRATPPIEHDDVVELFLRDVRVFSGRAKLGSRNDDGCQITISNAFGQLEEMTLHAEPRGSFFAPKIGDAYQTIESAQWYDTTTNTWRDPLNPITWTWGTTDSYQPGLGIGTRDINSYLSSELYLFRPQGGSLISVELQYLAFAYLLAGPQVNLLATGTTALGTGLYPRPQLVSSLSIAEGIRRTLALVPDSVTWVDYAAFGKPVLNLERFATGSASIRVEPEFGAVRRRLSLTIERLHHLVPPCVVLRRVAGGNPSTYTPPGVSYSAGWPVGSAATQRGALCHNVGPEVTDVEVQSLAYLVHQSLAVLRGQGTITVHDPSYSIGLRPGQILAASDEVSRDLQLCVQSTSWQASTGVATCQVGYPSHLSLRDMVDLSTWIRRAWSGY